MTTFRCAQRMAGLKASAVREILKATQSREVISFAGGLPAPELFPEEAIGEACREVLAREGQAALQYAVTEGYGPLREWVCRHLEEQLRIRTTPGRVLITSGSQQGLDLVARALLDPGDLVVTEQPAYLSALQAFAAAEAAFLTVASDGEGMVPESLEEVLSRAPRRPKLVYVNATFQNPSGITLPLERRRAVARIAAAAGVPIVEDDPYSTLRYEGEALPAIASLGGDVIYLGTSSKMLAPGLRVGWLVVPDDWLYDRVATLKQSADLHTAEFTQRVVHRVVMREGFLQGHLERLRGTYSVRRDVMLRALSEEMPDGVMWTRPKGGLFLWLKMPEGINTMPLLEQALARQVAFVPGEAFYVGEPERTRMRLNFSHAGEARIEEGVRRLAVVVQEALRGDAI